MKDGHVFTEGGLGKAPFKVIGYKEFSTGCAYCGRAIKKVSVILSSDGKQSNIGCECIKKAGDKGLIAGEKLAIKRFKDQVKYAKRMEAYFEVMFEKWGNHPHLDSNIDKNDKEAFLKDMERVQHETVNREYDEL